eukprot:sb/3478139/
MYSVLPVVNMMTEDYGLYVCSAQFDDGATSAASHNLVQSRELQSPIGQDWAVVSGTLMIQLVSGLVVVMVALIALGTAYICYRKNRAARSISPEPRTEQERPE